MKSELISRLRIFAVKVLSRALGDPADGVSHHRGYHFSDAC